MDIFEDSIYPYTVEVTKQGPKQFTAVMTAADGNTSPPVTAETGVEAIGKLVEVLLELQIMSDLFEPLIKAEQAQRN
jgi:hypothetical protein